MQPFLLKLLATLAGTAVLGYCVYFDQKRRNSPDYKEKVLKRREKQSKTEQNSYRELVDLLLAGDKMPEKLLYMTQHEELCGYVSPILEILQHKIPPKQFEDLIKFIDQHYECSTTEDDCETDDEHETDSEGNVVEYMNGDQFFRVKNSL